jgi:hypothetical protein
MAFEERDIPSACRGTTRVALEVQRDSAHEDGERRRALGVPRPVAVGDRARHGRRYVSPCRVFAHALEATNQPLGDTPEVFPRREPVRTRIVGSQQRTKPSSLSPMVRSWPARISAMPGYDQAPPAFEPVSSARRPDPSCEGATALACMVGRWPPRVGSSPVDDSRPRRERPDTLRDGPWAFASNGILSSTADSRPLLGSAVFRSARMKSLRAHGTEPSPR